MRKRFRSTVGLSDGKTLYQLYEEAHMPWDWHALLFEHARKLGIAIFNTPFDNTAVHRIGRRHHREALHPRP